MIKDAGQTLNDTFNPPNFRLHSTSQIDLDGKEETYCQKNTKVFSNYLKAT